MTLHRLAVLAACTFLVVGCRTTPRPDDVPTERMQPTTITDLLPDTTRFALAVRPAHLERTLEAAFGVSDAQRAAFWSGAPPIIQDVFGPESVAGIDRERRHLVVLSTAGQEDLLRHLHAGAPLPSQETLPGGMHLRMVVETSDAEAVARALSERCVQRSEGDLCLQFMRLTPYAGFLSVDILMADEATARADSVTAQRLDARLALMTRPAPAPPTAAWLAFLASDAAIAAHATMHDIFELAAMVQAERSLAYLRFASPQDAESLYDVTSATLSQGLLLESPEVAELYDVMLGFEMRGEALFVDGVGSLTPYGEAVEAAGHVAAPLSAAPTLASIVDLRWAFDMAAATAATELPLWAQRPENISAANFSRVLNDRFREVGSSANLAYLQYGITMLRAGFEHGTDFQVVGAQARTLRGASLRAGVKPDVAQPSFQDLIGALALVSGVEAGADAGLEALRPLLGQFGVPSDARTMAHADRVEYFLSVGAPVDEAFQAQDKAIAPGTALFVDLSELHKLATALMPQSPTAISDTQSAFVARFPRAHYSSHTRDGQWLVRLQVGAEDPQGLAPVAGAESVVPAMRTECAYRAAQESTDMLKLTASVTPPERRKLAATFVNELADLARRCPDDAQAQARIAWLTQIWQLRSAQPQ
ncbi:MAG: hypothetical protein H0U74_19920 [Bradymonadaceae bacterium]|nr:hypothetical protein [Lujinxingiaceae bacterium]